MTVWNPKLWFAEFSPVYFAMVMATGIVSIASKFVGFYPIDEILLWLNSAYYVVLWLLLIGKLLYFPDKILKDASDFKQAPGYFTIIAGTNVLGSQWVTVAQRPDLGLGLFVTGSILWVVILYSVFALLIAKEEKPRLEEGITGGWLVAVVSTQSVAVLGALLAPTIDVGGAELVFASICMLCIGGFLYLILITLIFYRLVFFRLSATQLAPLYCINMGAVAISTLAAANIGLLPKQFLTIIFLRPVIEASVILFFSVASWWIPLLFLLGFWKHIIEKERFTYSPQYWSLVFPLGMYTACSYRAAELLGLQSIFIIPHIFIYVALISWGLTTYGLVGELGRIFLKHETKMPE